jgi:hypothetical protein
MARKTYDTDQQISRLRNYNIVAGFLHLLQAVTFGYFLAQLPSQVDFPVKIEYMTGPPGDKRFEPDVVTLFNTNLGIGIVAFLALSALFHFLISSPWFYKRYAAGLKASHNYFRWVEYSLSSSVMIWLIAQLCGVNNIAALVAIFAVNASMIMFGALQEKYEKPGNKKFLPFIFGSMTGVVPWLIILLYTFQPGASKALAVPGFVVVIIITLFVLFNTFAINQVLQYRQVGKWKNYLQGERSYITLSLVAKSLLAWQVFSGAIVPVLTGNN